jgi:hypothetical protein
MIPGQQSDDVIAFCLFAHFQRGFVGQFENENQDIINSLLELAACVTWSLTRTHQRERGWIT